MTPETPPAGGGVFRRVLVGYDGSPEAQHALQVAAALAADLRGETDVLLVIRPGAHAETPEERDRALQADRDNLSKGLSSMRTLSTHPWDVSTEAVYADDPAQAIASYAEAHGFDLIVVGGHGREQMTHRGIGRSLEALLRHHPCPVLVV
ncbi:MAG TPA: universal stress protein [Acidimicrobiales bacterium]|nr:universal stress protein [Acidimicrobiales bacterium]